MDKYTQVLMTYLTRKWVALYAAGSLLAMLIFVLMPALSSSREPFTLVPLYYFFPLQFLGMHLKQQMASPAQHLVPGYRRPHLTIGFVWLAGPLVLVGLGAWIRESSVVGTMVVMFYVWLTYFYVNVMPGRLALGAVAIAFLAAAIPQLRAVVFDIILGREPLLAWSLFSAEAAAVVLLFHHLATLTEDDRDYGNVTAMNPWDLRASTVRKQQRAAMLTPGRFKNAIYASASRRLDRISQTIAKTFWQRVALNRVSEDWPTSWWFAVALIACIELFIVKQALSQILTEQAFQQAAMIPLTVSTWLSLAVWFTAYRRWGRLGYESLRPATRRQWVWENAAAMLIKVGQIQISWLLIQGSVLFIYFPEFRTSRVLPELFACSLGWQALIFGVSAWIASFGSFALKMGIMGAMIGVMSMMWIPHSFLNEQQARQMWLVTGVTTGAVGLGMCVVAYRRWCRIDFD